MAVHVLLLTFYADGRVKNGLKMYESGRRCGSVHTHTVWDNLVPFPVDLGFEATMIDISLLLHIALLAIHIQHDG